METSLSSFLLVPFFPVRGVKARAQHRHVPYRWDTYLVQSLDFFFPALNLSRRPIHLIPPQMYIQDRGLSPPPWQAVIMPDRLFLFSVGRLEWSSWNRNHVLSISLESPRTCLLAAVLSRPQGFCTCYFSTEEDNHGSLFYLCVSFMPLPKCVFLLRPFLLWLLSIRVFLLHSVSLAFTFSCHMPSVGIC